MFRYKKPTGLVGFLYGIRIVGEIIQSLIMSPADIADIRSLLLSVLYCSIM